MFLSHKYLSLSLLVLFTTGCGAQFAFRDLNSTNSSSSLSGSETFNLTPSFFSYTQDTYPRNTITVEFQPLDSNNMSLLNLTQDMILLTENNTPINQYKLTQQTTGTQKEADIVVVLDVTTSMDPSIDKVKSRIGGFVQTLSRSNIKARLCLVEFGETTEKVCDKFVEDDPRTQQNENYDAFIKDLNSIVTHGGGAEPDENQLPALEAAAQKTPWHQGSERVAILITDAGFHYAPDNIGEGRNVPQYKDTLKIIKDSGMQTFVISDYKYGYSAPLKGLAPLPEATGGQFYYLWDVLSGRKDMAEIFDNIASHLSTSYVIEYVVEDNPGLDSALPFIQRDIKIKIPAASSIKILNAKSDQPQGHPKHKNRFTLGSKEIYKESVVAYVNNTVAGNYTVDGQDIVFDLAPPAGSYINVLYTHKNLRENLNFSPLLLKINLQNKKQDISNLKVRANGIELYRHQLKVVKKDQKTYLIDLADELFSSQEDLLEIRKKGYLTLEYLLE